MEDTYNFNNNCDVGKSGFHWFNKPKEVIMSSSGFSIKMDSKHDFWRKTYYKPPFIKDDGHFLYKSFPFDANIMMETTLHLNAVNVFDQAGLMIRIDDKHWIKTGIEFVDGNHKLSCVVTNIFSDWSTQEYPSGDLSVRVYKFGQDYVVEAKQIDTWNFIRICHLDIESTKDVMLGLYACSPSELGGHVCFDYISYKTVNEYSHTY